MAPYELPRRYMIAYHIGRVLLWALFLFVMSKAAFPILFPSYDFSFNFENPARKSNSLENPRTNNGDPRGNGRLNADETLLIDASAYGDISQARVRLSGDDNVASLKEGFVSVRRSQKAFFYPEGTPATFPIGTLIRQENQYYAIDPDGTRKRFPSERSVRALGYDPESFLLVTKEELGINRENGFVVLVGDDPQDGAFIRSDDTYYEWRGGELIPFVSRESFLARFPDSWALPRDISFVESKPISDRWQGYPSGSLLAWGDGVFMMDGETPRPILGVDIFLSLGFSWDDVRPVNDEEISLSEKGKSVFFNASHPDGSVFFDTFAQKYFLIEDGEKREIRGEALRRMWLGNRHPIEVTSESYEKKATCVLQEEFSPFSTYILQCTVPLDALTGLPGDTYEFSIDTPAATDIRTMDVSFDTTVSEQTLLGTLSKLKQRIISRYIPAP